MPECDNCEAFVTAKYYRAMSVSGVLHCCPHCEDRKRGRDNKARATKSERQVHRGASERSRFDPSRAGGDD